MGPVGAGHLAAEPRRRDHLAGVREPVGIDRAPDPPEDLEIAIGDQRLYQAGGNFIKEMRIKQLL